MPLAIVDVSRVGKNASNTYTYNCAAWGALREGDCLDGWVFANLRQNQRAMGLGQYGGSHG